MPSPDLSQKDMLELIRDLRDVAMGAYTGHSEAGKTKIIQRANTMLREAGADYPNAPMDEPAARPGLKVGFVSPATLGGTCRNGHSRCMRPTCWV
jgi:hypothetical protein